MVIRSWAIVTIDGKSFDESKITSATFSDKAGHHSDQITIGLLPNVPRPRSKSVVTLELFNDLGEYIDCGIFHIQSVTRRDNKSLSFSATGAEFNPTQKDKRSNHYQETTLSGIVSLVAGRLGHKVKFQTEDQDVISMYQTDESDLQFLKRIATLYDVLFSIKNGTVYFVNKDDSALPSYSVDASKCSQISVKFSTKTQYKSCEMSFYDRKTAERIKVKIGDEEPILKAEGACKTEKEAQLKGKAKLAVAQRGTVSGSLTTIGQKLYAGTKLQLINTFKNEDDDTYAIESATHRYTRSAGWTVDVEFENFKLSKGK